jgi:hypothetical protein
LKGKLPYKGKLWPNGAARTQVLQVWQRGDQARASKSSNSLVPDTAGPLGGGESSDEELPAPNPIPARRIAISAAEKGLIEGAIDLAIAAALASEESSFVVPNLLTTRASVQTVAAAVANFLANRFQDFWLDEVLERVQEFEQPLG